jgi:hypothetical protein
LTSREQLLADFDSNHERINSPDISDSDRQELLKENGRILRDLRALAGLDGI